MLKKKRMFKLLRTLIYAFYIFLFISPIFIMLNTSLKKYEDIIKWPPTWFSGKLEWINYKTVLFGEKSILPALGTSFLISFASAFICVIIGILAAYAVARYRFRLRKGVLLLIILTQMFSEVILAAPIYMVFKHLGLLDTKLALIIANISVCLPMSLWLLYSYIKDIPKEIEEAAWVDGCSRLQGIRRLAFFKDIYIICREQNPGNGSYRLSISLQDHLGDTDGSKCCVHDSDAYHIYFYTKIFDKGLNK